MTADLRRIIWLASYPGSGNTWMRVFLSNLLADAERPADINALAVRWHAASRSAFDAYAGVRASELRDDEIDELRPAVYEALAADHEPPWFVKIHDAFSYTRSGEPLVSSRATRGAIYILRNPLDVAISWAYNRDVRIRHAIELMGDAECTLAAVPDGIVPQIRQRLGTWSAHVCGWVDAPLPVHVVRYEDMQADPIAAFGGAAAFAGLPVTTERLTRAIEFSRFAELRQQEETTGFRGRSRRSLRFFRRGQVDAWRDELTADQAAQIVAAHSAVMQRFGYLDARTGQPL
jgi:aryl sulfotransferase